MSMRIVNDEGCFFREYRGTPVPEDVDADWDGPLGAAFRIGADLSSIHLRKRMVACLNAGSSFSETVRSNLGYALGILVTEDMTPEALRAAMTSFMPDIQEFIGDFPGGRYGPDK